MLKLTRENNTNYYYRYSYSNFIILHRWIPLSLSNHHILYGKFSRLLFKRHSLLNACDTDVRIYKFWSDNKSCFLGYLKLFRCWNLLHIDFWNLELFQKLYFIYAGSKDRVREYIARPLRSFEFLNNHLFKWPLRKLL